MSEILRAEGLVKDFGDVPVLRGVDLSLQAGEFVCIWGPSGSGKSTLLHVLGLMTPLTRGSLHLLGRDISAESETALDALRREKIGFLFQFHHLLPDLSLWENVTIPLLIRRRPWEEARAAARQLLVRLGLEHRLDHRPGEASGGEQQRAALARAVVGNPGLLLADEPTGNLDRAAGREVEALLREEVRSRGATLVLVTHNAELADHADRRVELVDGQLRPIPE